MAKPSSFVDVFKEFLGADWFDTQSFPMPTSQARPRSTAFAQYLLTHSKPGPTINPFEDDYTKEGATTEEPSFLNKTFDFLDTVTGSRSARNIVDQFTDGEGSILGDLGRSAGAIAGGVGSVVNDITSMPLQMLPGIGDNVKGFSDKLDSGLDKINPDIRGRKLVENIFGEADSRTEDYSQGIAGLVAELALDPTLAFGGGLAKGGAKGLKASDALTSAAAKNPGDVTPFVRPTPPVINPGPSSAAVNAMKGGRAPGLDIGSILPNKVDVPVAPENMPRVDTSAGREEIAYGILNDPDSMAEMRKAKKSDDGWRAAQRRWNRDPDVEQAHLDNAVSKAVWFEDMQAKKLAKQGKVTDGKGRINQISVARVLKNIEEGEIPRWGPEPVAADGLARDIAIKAADDHLDAITRKGTRTDLNPANQANLYNRMYDATEQVFKSDPELAKKYTVTNSSVKLSKEEKAVAKEIESSLDTGKDGFEFNDLLDELNVLKGNKVISGPTAKKLADYYRTREVAVNVNSPRARAARRVMARAMLRTAEERMMQLGKQPQYWDGTRVRLSDVLEEIGLEASDELATTVMNAWKTKDMSRIKEPAVAEAIHRALARRPLHLSGLLEDFEGRAKILRDSILDNYTYPKAQEKLAELSNDAGEVAKRAGLTDDEIDAVKKLVANVIDVDKIPPDKFLSMLGARMHEAMIAGRVDKEALYKLNKEITKTLGQTKKDLMTNVTGHKVVDGFMLRFSTSFGRHKEMKMFSDDVMTWGEMNAVARARWMRNMVHAAGNNPDTVHQAFKIAQGMSDASVFPDAATAKLAKQMTDYFETMLGSSGMSKMMQGHTVATRSQIVMEDVNKHLKAVGSNFQFTNKKGVKDQFLGLSHDFSATGEGWVSSWKMANPKGAKQDPVSFLYDLDLAIERTTKEYALIDEFGRSFGFRKGDVGFDPKIHTARLKSDRLPHDVFFRPEDRDMMQRLLHDVEDGLWRPNSKLMQHYARGLRIWKTGVTIYTPSHHIRNMIGDLHLMWWAGHNDPRNFIRAAKILHSQKSKYEAAMKMDDLDALKGLIDKDAMEWAATRGGDVIIKQNGVSLTADQIYIAAHQHGLLLDANKYEDIFGQAPLENVPLTGKLSPGMQRRIAEPLGGKAHHVAAKVLAENREHYVRLSHFVGAVNKGLKKNKDIAKVFEDAAHEVRKWHPDGRDLTKFEQKARYVIPFYSWTRKAVPLIVQSAATRPSKVLYYPRTQMAMSELWADNENPTHLDPFPDNQLFPEWIRAKGIGPIFNPQSSDPFSAWFGKFGNNSLNLEGEETGYVVANPSNPFNDVIEQIAGFGGSPMELGKSFFDSATPAMKIPGELAFDRTFSGAPISDDKPGGKGVGNYLFNQIPIVSMGNNVLEYEFGDQKQPEGKENGKDIQALINYLTALGLRGTGPYEKSAEFEAKDRASNG